MELGHLLTRSGLTYLEVSSKICHDSFCQLWNSVSLPWVIYYQAFYLHVVSSFSCIPVICLKLALFLIPLQFVYCIITLLRIFDRQILRKIFGPVNIDNIWRIPNNMEIYNITEGADIVRFIKAQRIKWLGHIQRVDQARPTRKLVDWRPVGTRPVGRPRQRWQEDVMEDLKEAESKKLEGDS